MFECRTCTAHENEILFLREQIKSLSDRLLALTNPHALAALRHEEGDVQQYYGSSTDDKVLAFDEFGQQTEIDREKTDR